MFKKIISILLTVVLLFTCTLSSYAALPGGDSIVQPMYNYVDRVDTTLSITNGKALCKVDILGYSTTTKIEIDLTLQKKTALWWSTVEAWEVNYLQYTAQHSRTFSVNSGTYRLKAVYKVYSGTNYETITEYSGTKSC